MLFESKPIIGNKLLSTFNVPPPLINAAVLGGMESKGIIEINGGSHSGSSGRSTPNISSEPSPGKLFVGGLSWQTSCERLREYFGMFGNVTDVLIMKDPISQRSRGFGFITFSEPSSVDNVLKVPIHTIDGKKVDPKHATPKNRPKVVHRTKKIFVGGVSQDTSSEEVRAYFVQFGKVEDASLLMDQQTKRHRGFGFVTFESEDVVDTVCDIHFHTIKNKKVECKKAQPKENVNLGNQLVGKRLMINSLGMRVHNPVAAAGALAANPLVVAQAAQAHAHAQAQAHAHAHAHAQAQAQAQAHAFAANVAAQTAAFGKVFSPYPPLASYRYSPYAIPTMTANVAAAPPPAPPQTTQGTPVPQPANVTPVASVTAVAPVTPVQPVQSVPNVAPIAPVGPGAPVPPGPYQGYNLANIDMSSFQGIDWATLYQFGGMYG